MLVKKKGGKAIPVEALRVQGGRGSQSQDNSMLKW